MNIIFRATHEITTLTGREVVNCDRVDRCVIDKMHLHIVTITVSVEFGPPAHAPGEFGGLFVFLTPSVSVPTALIIEKRVRAATRSVRPTAARRIARHQCRDEKLSSAVRTATGSVVRGTRGAIGPTRDGLLMPPSVRYIDPTLGPIVNLDVAKQGGEVVRIVTGTRTILREAHHESVRRASRAPRRQGRV